MGRHRTNEVYSYFTIVGSHENAKAACNVIGCTMVLRHPCATNLMKHLERHHKAEFEILARRREAATGKRLLQLDDKKSLDHSQAKIAKNIHDIYYSTINIPMDIKTFNNAMIELVTLNGRPFFAVEDSGLRKLIDPIKRALNTVMDRKKISNLVDEKAAEIVNQISGELQNRMFSLKIDIASHLDRSVLALNAQVIIKDSLQIRTLAVTDFSSAHTGENIKEIVINVLSKYNLSLNQVYSMTVDCARNDDGTEIASEENYISKVEDIKIGSSFFVKCAAHALQLAVKDALNGELYANTIAHARNISKKLSTPVIMNILKVQKYHMPIVDVVTGWCSTYKMINRLMELRPFIEEFVEIIGIDFKFSLKYWVELQEIMHVLEPAKKAIVRLQEENLTPGDFYKVWFVCKSEISKIDCMLAYNIIEAMNARESELLKNEIILASLYLDPRFSVMLSEAEEERAISHLIRLNGALSAMHPKPELEVVSEHMVSATTEDELENMLRFAAQSKKSLNATKKSISSSLRDFSNTERIPADSCLISWWNTMKIKYEDLYKLAIVVHAVPMTQVSVKRLFSIFETILSPQRNNLIHENLENILIVHSNFHI
uniref:HAT C-terminal dimerisation domain-containing protein n=1 Tax=Octopus bimaculoides TaxID=37653 RepID=A0A0L8FS48_OCTBM